MKAVRVLELGHSLGSAAVEVALRPRLVCAGREAIDHIANHETMVKRHCHPSEAFIVWIE